MKTLENKLRALYKSMQSEGANKAFEDLLNATPEQLTEAYRRGITPRTSVTSPLRIDAIDLHVGNAAIGMTLCPGKQGPSEYGGPWLRDLTIDMAVLKDWGCKALLTLMEPEELQWFNVLNIGEIAEGMGIKWYHLPITDGDPPDQRFIAAWPVIGRELLSFLKNGDRVVVHCRGGLGRTGTVACLLLMEFGTSPQEALEMVRSCRPGCVETLAQEQFIKEYKSTLV